MINSTPIYIKVQSRGTGKLFEFCHSLRKQIDKYPDNFVQIVTSDIEKFKNSFKLITRKELNVQQVTSILFIVENITHYCV